MTSLHNERSKALLNFLEWCHAEDYMGTDDDMSDAANEWISGLSDEEITELVLETFHDGF